MTIPLPRTRRRRAARPPVDLPENERSRRRRPARRAFAGAAAGAMLAAVAAGALLVGGGAEPETETNASLEFATVRRTDLVAVRSFDGDVASKDGPSLPGRLNGTITAMTAEGTKVERGQTLYAVDGRPVVLLYGSVPAYRDIGGTITGDDVRQLEENLEALGYETGTVDETFTSTTASAISSWQEDLGVTEDGVVRLGTIVFAPGPLTVAEHVTDVGAASRDGEEIMTTVSTEKIVTVTLEDSDDLKAGDAVTLTLPDNSKAAAKVSTVEEPSGQAAEGSSPVATIAPDDADALASLEDGANIDVEIVEDSREDVLAVPVTALVARQSGGYAVEVQRGGTTELVTVEPGLYADDLVEVQGDLKEGDRVVVP